MTTKTNLLKTFSMLAKDADRRNDVTARNQASNNWRENATESQASRAPKYLTWNGRR